MTKARSKPKGGSSRARRPPLPAVDERLVMPETRYEIIDGRVVYVPPAKEPHGSRHSKVAAIVEAHVVDAYDVAADMLTRTSHDTDVAPDVSVFLRERDPETGGRRLEEITFEVVDTTKLGAAAKKARRLAARGVRRLFALDVKKKRALEWSPPTNTWRLLPIDAQIEDPVFVVPLAIDALVVAAKADDAMARALIAKGNPVIEAKLEEARVQGRVEARVEALLAVLRARGLRVTARDEAALRSSDVSRLSLLLERAVSCRSVRALLADPRRTSRKKRSR